MIQIAGFFDNQASSVGKSAAEAATPVIQEALAQAEQEARSLLLYGLLGAATIALGVVYLARNA